MRQVNHKSDQMNKRQLTEFVPKDVKCGYHMPLTIKAAKKIKDGVVALYGITKQTTFSDLGKKVPKT